MLRNHLSKEAPPTLRNSRPSGESIALKRWSMPSLATGMLHKAYFLVIWPGYPSKSSITERSSCNS